METLRRALWVLSVFGALTGIYILVQAARKAPTEQELANCAMMVSCALVPYCLARSVTEVTRK